MNAGDDEWTVLSSGLPDAPQVRSVVVHPDDPSVIYAGVHDGPYRSTDGGDTWECLPLDARLPVWALAFDPSDSRVVYCGIGPSRLYRSGNGGDSWSPLANAVLPERLDMGFPTRLISIAVDPSDPASIYAGIEVGGVMHSGDGGQTWNDCSQDLVRLADEQPQLRSRLLSDTELEGMLDTHALVVSAAAPGRPFLANRMGLFQSDDGGRHWADLQVGAHSPLTYCRHVAVSPHDPGVLFACFSDEAQGVAGSVYRSDNLGRSWSRFDRVTPTSTMMKVDLNPLDEQQVWCATRNGEVYATGDGGATWTEHHLPPGGRDVYALCAG
jgi:photosystem II stability/assembly factor-like uncharacterized protein